jgi:hypothetical protein
MWCACGVHVVCMWCACLEGVWAVRQVAAEQRWLCQAHGRYVSTVWRTCWCRAVRRALGRATCAVARLRVMCASHAWCWLCAHTGMAAGSGCAWLLVQVAAGASVMRSAARAPIWAGGTRQSSWCSSTRSQWCHGWWLASACMHVCPAAITRLSFSCCTGTCALPCCQVFVYVYKKCALVEAPVEAVGFPRWMHTSRWVHTSSRPQSF